jgi:hypothetical protein
MSDDANDVLDLVRAMNDLVAEWKLDSVAVVVNTSLGKLRLTACTVAPLVIEDMNGNSLVGDIVQ